MDDVTYGKNTRELGNQSTEMLVSSIDLQMLPMSRDLAIYIYILPKCGQFSIDMIKFLNQVE